MKELLVDLYKFCFKLCLSLNIAMVCLCSRDCQLPVKPVYGTYHMEGNTLAYTCMKGYGLLGTEHRLCVMGRWNPFSPFCVKAASPVVNDQIFQNLTDDDTSTCLSLSKGVFSVFGLSISSVFKIDASISRAIIRIDMTAYPLSLRPILINNQECHHPKETYTRRFYSMYEYNCSLIHIKSSIIEITITRNIAFTICEIQVLPVENVACPLLEVSEVKGTIMYDPEVIGNTTIYGTAATFSCNHNATLQGSEVRYCINGSQWSGSQTYCEEKIGTASMPIKHFQVIVYSSAAAGIIIIVIIILVFVIVRKKRAKARTSQDTRCIDTRTSHISMIDHYYDTANYDERNIWTSSVPSENEECGYCAMTESATSGGTSTNWKFALFTDETSLESPVYMTNNDFYIGE